jgi:hypothetical protein
MPSMSKETARDVNDVPAAIDHTGDLDGYSVSFVTLRADADLTPLLAGLPNDECPCPHWGYVFKGRMWWRVNGRLEEHGPGEAFYVPAGHTTGGDAGSEFLIFSPAEQVAEVHEHMGRRAQQLMESRQALRSR